MWPGLNSRTRHHIFMYESVVGSLFDPRGFSLGTPVFPFPQKPTFVNSDSIWNLRARGFSDCLVLPCLALQADNCDFVTSFLLCRYHWTLGAPPLPTSTPLWQKTCHTLYDQNCIAIVGMQCMHFVHPSLTVMTKDIVWKGTGYGVSGCGWLGWCVLGRLWCRPAQVVCLDYSQGRGPWLMELMLLLGLCNPTLLCS